MEKDVATEKMAFKYAKEEFLSVLDHDEENIYKALGIVEKKIDSNREWLFTASVATKQSKAFEMVVTKSDNIGELIINLLFYEHLRDVMKKGVLKALSEL